QELWRRADPRGAPALPEGSGLPLQGRGRRHGAGQRRRRPGAGGAAAGLRPLALGPGGGRAHPPLPGAHRLGTLPLCSARRIAPPYGAERNGGVRGGPPASPGALPAHHPQVNTATGRRDNPRIARFLFNSGYGEGWALYAERLADELGLYENDASRFGMLSNAAWRACRLIVDSGLHAFGWDRERAVALLLARTPLSPAQAP